jgi:hypothetical protein
MDEVQQIAIVIEPEGEPDLGYFAHNHFLADIKDRTSPGFEQELAKKVFSLANDEQLLRNIFQLNEALTLTNIANFIEELTQLNPRATILYLSSPHSLLPVLIDDYQAIIIKLAKVALSMIEAGDLLDYYPIFWPLLTGGYEQAFIELFKKTPAAFDNISLELDGQDNIKLFTHHFNLFCFLAVELPAFSNALKRDKNFLSIIEISTILKKNIHLAWVLLTSQKMWVGRDFFMRFLRQGGESAIVKFLEQHSEVQQYLWKQLKPKDLNEIYQNYPKLFCYLATNCKHIFSNKEGLNSAVYPVAVAIDCLTTTSYNLEQQGLGKLNVMVAICLKIPAHYWLDIASRIPEVLVKCLVAYLSKQYITFERSLQVHPEQPLWKKCSTWSMLMNIMQYDMSLAVQLCDSQTYRYGLRQDDSTLLSLSMQTCLQLESCNEYKQEPEEQDAVEIQSFVNKNILILHKFFQACAWTTQFELMNHLAKNCEFASVLDLWFDTAPSWRDQFLRELYQLKECGIFYPDLIAVIPQCARPDLEDYPEIHRLVSVTTALSKSTPTLVLTPDQLPWVQKKQIESKQAAKQATNPTSFMPIPAAQKSAKVPVQAASAPSASSSSWLSWMGWGK